MSEGLDQAAAAFAEDLGSSSTTPVRPSRREESDEAGDIRERGAVEVIGNPVGRDITEPGGGDPDFEEEGDGEEGDEPPKPAPKAKANDRDENGQFKKKSGDAPAKSRSLEELLEDPLDDEEGGEGNEEGDEGDGKAPISAERLDPKDLDTEVEVKIDGKPAKVKLKEALDGYIRQETFHRRLTDLDKVVKEVRGERDQVNRGRDVYIEKLTQVAKQLDAMVPQEPDWTKRYAEAPNEAPREHQKWIDYKATRAKMDEELNAEKRTKLEEDQRAFKQWADDQRTTFATAHPEYTSAPDADKRWARDREGMRKTGLDHGFSEEEIANVSDARYMEILLKASKYDRLMARKPVAQTDARSARDGRGASRTQPKSTNASKRLAQSGSTRDAANVFAAELLREG